MRCMRRLLRISYLERKTNEFVRDSIRTLVGPQEPVLATVKRRKLQWFGHVTRHNTLSKIILQGTVEGGRKRGRQRKSWSDNVKEWTSLDMGHLLQQTTDRQAWRRVSYPRQLIPPDDDTWSRDECVSVCVQHICLIKRPLTYTFGSLSI